MSTEAIFGPHCLVCGAEDFAPFARTPPGEWVRCRRCGLVRQVDPPPESVTQARYGFAPGHEEAAAEATPASWGQTRPDAHSQFKYWIVGEALRSRGLSGRLVDVGCGNGLLQLHLASLGFEETVGVEPGGNPTGRRDLGLAIYNEPVEVFLERRGMTGGFAIAVANHVLEHAYDPMGLLLQLRALVRPGGHVLVATPNLAGAAMRWKTLLSRLSLKARPFRHLDYPKHLVLFDRRNLPRLVASAGLEVLAVETYTRASSDSSSRPARASLWDALGLGDNMYVLARRP
ncbi:MAG TPA: class I SAM-dependent methyltransferase [Thermoanaerobaculia bacterium]